MINGVRRDAPGISLVFVQPGQAQAAQALRRGETDRALGLVRQAPDS